MLNSNEKYTNRLYTRISLLIFFTFLLITAMTFLILFIFTFSPLLYLFVRNLAGSTLIILIITYLVCSFIGSILCYIIAKRILHPIVELSNTSIRVAKGDFDVTVKEETSISELNELLHNFNIMVRELAKVETLSNDFVSNVSHEFKTPLAIIRSNVNILENTTLSEEDKQSCLHKINESTEKLSSLISNVLKLSKLDNQKIELNIVSFRLDEQIRKALLTYSNQLEEKEIELDLNLDDCTLNSDEEFLAPVWDNLISNAIKFSHNRGKIGINLTTNEQKQIIVEVWDNGIGMSEETQNHIFERFYQGETSHTKEGNGLGLTIVFKILKVCNASIQVESILNEGTKFTIIF